MLEESQETPPEQADQDDDAAVASPAAPETPEASTPRRRRGRRPVATTSAEPEPAPEPPRRGRGGGVARETHAEVGRLEAQGLTRTQAFARLAEASGRRPATVAAAYYRAARAAGAGRPRRRRAAAAPAGDGTERLVAALQTALGELGEIVHRQEQELERLRSDAERYAEVRALLEGGTGGRTGRRRRGGG